MIKGDELLNEDTSHIRKSVDKVSKGSKFGFKTRVVVTIITGVIVVYAGFYTLYNVYIIPNNNKVGEIKNPKTEFEKGYEHLEKVPYNLNEDIVYNDYGETIYNDLDKEFILSYLIENLETDEYMNLSNCPKDNKCIEILSQTLSSKHLKYYGSSLGSLPESLNLKNGGSCTFANDIYSCTFPKNKLYSGKISEIELIKEDEKKYYVYEKALFVKNAEIKEKILSFDYISKKPSISTAIKQNFNADVESDNLNNEVLNLFVKDSFIYLHTFEKSGDKMNWIKSEVVKQLPKS